MNDKCTTTATSASGTRKTGASLARTLEDCPLTVALTGDLGSGKTTFLQGFAQALGVREPLVSPTYALEQRYASLRGPFLHLDLYRLSDVQAQELLRGSDDCTGIRCIEWSERISIERLICSGPVIHIHIEDVGREKRMMHCDFLDAPLPTDEQIVQWRKDVMLPPHIIDHCDAVAALCDDFADALLRSGRIVRPLALQSAAQVHDLLRFLDFRTGGHPENDHTPEMHTTWDAFRSRYLGLHHEQACAEFLRERGYSVIAAMVSVHGLIHPPGPGATIEQQILFYADKRVLLDRVVTLEERFADFAERYGKGVVSDEAKRWYAMTRMVETELFPDGPPV